MCSTTAAETVPASLARSVTTLSPPVNSTSGVNDLPGVHGLPIDQKRLPLLDPVLLSTDFDHRVHELLQRKTMPADAGEQNA